MYQYFGNSCNMQGSPSEGRNDFIPLDTSSPIHYNRMNNNRGNWRTPRGNNRYSGGYNNYHNNSYQNNSYQNNSYQNNSYQNNSYQNKFYNHPRSHPNSPYSPHRGKSFRGRGKNFNRQLSVSNYFDATSIFENPWEELLEQHHCTQSDKSCSTKNDSSQDFLSSSQLSFVTANENFTNTTDVSDSQHPKERSSTDIKIDNFVISQETSFKDCSQSSNNALHSSSLNSSQMRKEISVNAN